MEDLKKQLEYQSVTYTNGKDAYDKLIQSLTEQFDSTTA